MILHFEAEDFFFRLEDTSVANVLSLPEHEKIEAYYPEAETAIDKDGNIRLFAFELWKSPGQLDSLIENPLISQIPGLYTVPELGVENATFKEVLKAVKRYYEEKLSSKHPAKTS